MRERQLALCVTKLEAGATEAKLLRTRGSVEEGRVRHVLEQRERQLVRLVKELYELATAEKIPGVIAHDARSRVFRRCATVYEQLGEAAFHDDPGSDDEGRRDEESPPPDGPPDAGHARDEYYDEPPLVQTGVVAYASVEAAVDASG